MKRHLVWFGLLILLAGCTQDHAGVDVLQQEDTTGVVFATTECTVKGPNGTCNVKTCRTDAESNCQQFATACLDTGHHYSGTSDGGT